MKEELERLSSLGVQKIYDDTHIPAHHIQALLHGSFDGFSKVQFLGFISILEREYNSKLPQLKLRGLEHFDEKDARSLDDGLIVMPSKKKTKAPLYISSAVIVLLLVLFMNFFIFQGSNELHNSVDNTLIQDVQKNIIEPKNSLVILTDEKQEENASQEQNSSLIESSVEEVTPIQEQNIIESFKIVPRTKVWFGYIDVDTNKKHQTTLKDAMNLDTNKSWLLLFGHGYIDMYINGELQKFDSRNKRRFLYKNNSLKAIDSDEFKNLNRGLQW